MKRQLDYFTVTANYHECRLAHSIAAYNDTSTIDIDKLREEELERIRALIEADEATLACFLTAKPVSYTHLDVYKRQGVYPPDGLRKYAESL